MKDYIIKSKSEIRDISEGVIKGYANVYNVEDSDGDISMPGSFTKTVTEQMKRIKVYKDHVPQLVGIPTELDTSDQYGLRGVFRMAMDTTVGRDAFHQVKFLVENGRESGLSIGGWVIKRNPVNKKQVVEYKLKEISVLTSESPANALSLIDTVKSLKEPKREEFWELVTKAYNERFSDDVLKSLEAFLTLKDRKPGDATSIAEPSRQLINFYNQLIFEK